MLIDSICKIFNGNRKSQGEKVNCGERRREINKYME